MSLEEFQASLGTLATLELVYIKVLNDLNQH